MPLVVLKKLGFSIDSALKQNGNMAAKAGSKYLNTVFGETSKALSD